MTRGTNISDFASETELLAWVRANPDAPITCSCNGEGCERCAGDGTFPAWVLDPQITGYPHERRHAEGQR